MGTKLFYQNQSLLTLVQNDVTSSILRASGAALAERRAGAGSNQTLLTATNEPGSVLHVSTNSGENQSLSYTSYGAAPTSLPLLPALMFNGERRESFTNGYLLGNGHRQFNTMLRRFCAPDSKSPFGEGGLNSYCYCNGDPINFVDPSGQMNEVPTRLQLRRRKITAQIVPNSPPPVRSRSGTSAQNLGGSAVGPQSGASVQGSVLQPSGTEAAPPDSLRSPLFSTATYNTLETGAIGKHIRAVNRAMKVVAARPPVTNGAVDNAANDNYFKHISEYEKLIGGFTVDELRQTLGLLKGVSEIFNEEVDLQLNNSSIRSNNHPSSSRR